MRNNRSGRIGSGLEIPAIIFCIGFAWLDVTVRDYQTHLRRMENNPVYRQQYELKEEEQKVLARQEWDQFMDTRMKYAMFTR